MCQLMIPRETNYQCLECRAAMELVGLHVEHPDPVPPECRAILLGVPMKVVIEGSGAIA